VHILLQCLVCVNLCWYHHSTLYIYPHPTRIHYCSCAAKNAIPIPWHKRAQYGTELQYRNVQLGQSLCISSCIVSALQLESTC